MRIISYSLASLAAVAILTAATGNRGVTENAKSPSADTSITLAGQKVTIEYNAPSASGRKVEGELIPYTRYYRLGADNATTLTADTNLMIGNLKVPKGVYTLYLHAKENGDWQLAVNKETGQWGTVYHANQDLGRTPMKLTKLDTPLEKFKITLTSKSATAGELAVEWGQSKAVVPVSAE